jgi:RimJ/RimL family protein N-acetyltransferase
MAEDDPLAYPIRLSGRGLVLREWTDDDLPDLPALLADPDVDRFTPIKSPFDPVAYLAGVRRGRAEDGRVSLAVTTDGAAPLGLAFLHPGRGEIGYAVGPAHRGRGLALRSTLLLTELGHDRLGLPELVLRISPFNGPSRAVAQAAGYRLTDRLDEAGQVWTHTADQQ